MRTEDLKTKWDLELLYESPEDEVDKDIEHAQKAYEEFADKYRNSDDYLQKPEALREALEDFEYLGGEKNLAKPLFYFNYRKKLKANDQEAESKVNQLSQVYSKLENKIRFFELNLGDLPKAKQEEFLSAKELEHYHKYLEWVFKTAQFNLDEKEENILSLTNLPRNKMWVKGVQKAISQKTIEWEDDELPLSEALSKIEDLPTKKRRRLHTKCMKTLQEVKEFSESEINAVVTDKKISDEVRGYEKPYSSAVLKYENTPEEVETLVNTVTKNFDVVHEFYDLKAELLEEDALQYADRSASIGSLDKELSFEQAVEIVHDSFANMDADFSNTLEQFLKKGQIDVFPQEKKSGGAFCSGAPYLPTYILLNYTPSFRQVTTLAHEMGHAIHTELSKEQSPMYQKYTISTAEVASTFFESVVFNRVFENLNENEQIIALHNKINRDVSTVFRQIACFNFEKELHGRIREKGSCSHEDIAKLMNKHMQNYLGDRFEMKDEDGYFFINWTHIRRPFYVYTYAYGDLISKALHSKYQEDEEYLDKVKQFLKAGSTKSPQDIFADIGVDTSSPNVFTTGIESIREDIQSLKKLI